MGFACCKSSHNSLKLFIESSFDPTLKWYSLKLYANEYLYHHLLSNTWVALILSSDPLMPNSFRPSDAKMRRFRWWLGAWSTPTQYLNQCWNVVNWTPRNKLQWNFHWNSHIFIQENALENVVCEVASILSRPQCVNYAYLRQCWFCLTFRPLGCSLLIQDSIYHTYLAPFTNMN